MNIRIIPRLDIKGPNLVKGIHLEGLRVLGKPSDFAKYYYENGADELLYMDVVASLYERNSLKDLIIETAKEIFIPLTVGGGIRTINDIKSVLRAGADKVLINTAGIKNPEFIREAVLEFGSSTIVIAIEAIKQQDGRYLAFIDNGREFTGLEVVEWAKKIQELGAGEIVVSSVDKDGTGKGFEIDIIKKVAEELSIPVVAHAGAGCKEDVLEVINETTIDAVCIASMFHYEFIKNNIADHDNAAEGNFDFIKSGQTVKHIQSIDIKSLKNYLLNSGKNVRPN